jgi:hypothetical protein
MSHESDSDFKTALVAAIRSIAHGGISGPEGLEALAVALAGNNLKYPVGTQIMQTASALSDAAIALGEVASAIDNVADAIRSLKAGG